MFYPIPGFPNYEISKFGEVRNAKTKRFLALRTSPDGYLCVRPYANKQVKTISIHRLLALAFIPNPRHCPQVNHKNGVKIDNRLVNLEWCTLSENRQHAYRTGLQKGHSKWRKLSDADARAIRENKDNLTHAGLAAQYGVSRSLIGMVINNKRRRER